MKKLLAVIAALALSLCLAPNAFAQPDEEMVAQSDPVNGELSGEVLASELISPTGVYALAGDTKLVLDISTDICCIYDTKGMYNLSIEGDGILTIEGGMLGVGIAVKSLEMNGGCVQIINDTNVYNYGIWVEEDFVMNGGDVYAEGTKRGVHVGRYFRLAGGYLEAVGGNVGLWANGSPGGFKITDGTLVASGAADMAVFACDMSINPDVFKDRYPTSLFYDLSVPVSIITPESESEDISGYTFFTGGSKETNVVIGGHTPMNVQEIPFEAVTEKLQTGARPAYTAKISDKKIGSNKAADFVKVCKEGWVDVSDKHIELNSSYWFSRPAAAGHTYEYYITFKAAKNLVFGSPVISYKGTTITPPFVDVSKDGHYLTIRAWINSGQMLGFDRLSGDGALDTMAQIVTEGNFAQHGTVVLASVEGYWDALTAAGVAGLYDAPVVMTYGTKLADQAKELIGKLRPETIYVCGGKMTLSDDTVAEAKAAAGTSPAVERLSGDTATGTANDIYSKSTGWQDDTALIATVGTFQDALAAAPIAFAKKWPIFLAEYDWETGKGMLSAETLAAMQKGGIKYAYIVGGEYWISKDVDKQLALNGITVKKRLAGETAVETSSTVAVRAITGTDNFGMTPNGLGVASSQVYQDALAGAALCGIHNTPMILVLDENSSTISGYVKGYHDDIDYGHVFGGTTWVTEKTFDALNEARNKG